jgi:hypothetical protein
MNPVLDLSFNILKTATESVSTGRWVRAASFRCRVARSDCKFGNKNRATASRRRLVDSGAFGEGDQTVKAKAAELISHTPLGKVIEWMSGDPEKCGYRHFRCCEERVHVTEK